MNQETLMTDAPQTPTEGQAVSQPAEGSTQQSAAPEASTQQASESQSAESQQAEGEQGEGKPQGAPEQYEFKAPEGKEYDPKVIETYSKVAKELNLTQEAAQKMIDELAPVIQSQQVERIEAIRNKWADDSKADKEFGGEKLQESLTFAKKALDQFGTPELRTLLDQSGLGNNPDVIRFMVRAGRAISEDKFVGGSQGAAAPGPKTFNDMASALYPNQQ